MSTVFLVVMAVVVILAVVALACAFKFGAKPLSTRQKVGVTVSVVALLSLVFMPIVSLGGIVAVDFQSIISDFISASWDTQVDYCMSSVPLAFTVAIFMPIIAAMMIIYNRGKRFAGALLLIAPIYEICLFSFDSSFRGLSIGNGMFVYLLCGVLLLVLPWILKETEATAKGAVKPFVISVTIYASLALLPALVLQYAAYREDYEVDYTMEDDPVCEEEPLTDVFEEEEEIFPMANGDIQDLQISYAGQGVPPYDFGDYIIQMVSDHGSMVIRARDRNESDWIYLPTVNLFSMGDPDDFDGEVFFAQADLDEDGKKELIVGARNIDGNPAGIAVNIYRLFDSGTINIRQATFAYEPCCSSVNFHKGKDYFDFDDVAYYELQPSGIWERVVDGE